MQGIVTAIERTHYDPNSSYSIEVEGSRREPAAHFVLVASVLADMQHLLDQAQRGVTSGVFEVQLCQEGNRVYFADTAEQVMQLLSLKIGIHADFLAEELDRLKQATAAGLGRELRFRGYFRGQLAYVVSSQARPAPLYAVGQIVYLFNGYQPYAVSERFLVKGNLAHQLPAGRWYYQEASDAERLHQYPQDVVTDEPLTGPNIPVIPAPAPDQVPTQPTLPAPAVALAEFSDEVQHIIASK